jgi:hypothetical protein
MTSLIRLFFPRLRFAATAENFEARLEKGDPGNDREREDRLIQALDRAATP